MSWFLQILIIVLLILIGVIPTMLLRRNMTSNPRSQKEHYIALLLTIIWPVTVALIIGSIFLKKQMWLNMIQSIRSLFSI